MMVIRSLPNSKIFSTEFDAKITILMVLVKLQEVHVDILNRKDQTITADHDPEASSIHAYSYVITLSLRV